MAFTDDVRLARAEDVFMRHLLVAVAVLVLALAGAGSSDHAAPSVGSTGAIVFASVAAGEGYELYTVDLRGVITPRTANSPQLDYVSYEGATPKWSPDGRSIAVDSYAGLDPVATEPELVGVPLLFPSWAPNGREIVGRTQDGGEIAIFDLGTRKQRVIYEPWDSPGFPPDPEALDPDWSPKGGTIAMALVYSDDEGQRMRSGIGLFSLTSHRFIRSPLDPIASLRDLRHPAWSPDARKIAFDARAKAQRATAPRSIYVAAVGSTRQPRLVVRDGRSPSWSPDGKQIVFVRNVTRTNSEIFVVDADGTDARRLTTKAGNDTAPDWRPSPRR